MKGKRGQAGKLQLAPGSPEIKQAEFYKSLMMVEQCLTAAINTEPNKRTKRKHKGTVGQAGAFVGSQRLPQWVTSDTLGSPCPQEPCQTLGDPRRLSCAVLGTCATVPHIAFGPCEHLQATGQTTKTKLWPRKASPQKRCHYRHVSAGELQKAALCSTVSYWKDCKVRNEKRTGILIGEKRQLAGERKSLGRDTQNTAGRGQLLPCDSFWRPWSNGIYSKKH